MQQESAVVEQVEIQTPPVVALELPTQAAAAAAAVVHLDPEGPEDLAW